VSSGPTSRTLDRAIGLHQSGRLAEAEQLYREILSADSRQFDALHMLGVIRHQQSRNSDALALIERALQLRPGSILARGNLGVVLLGLKRFEEALAAFDAVLAATPEDEQAHNNRGNVLQGLKRYDEALACYDRALALRPDFVLAHNNRGNAMLELQRCDEAIACYDRALALMPDYPEALRNRAAALQALNRYEDALADYQRVLAFDPGDADAQWSESLAHLCLGDFAAGLPKFEARWRTSDSSGRAPFPHPLWLGETPLAGRTILLHAEQGLGDTLQFVRYAPLVAGRGGDVVLAVHHEIKSLVMGMPGVRAVFAEGEPLPPFELRCPLLSLPLAFGTSVQTIPAQIPYLEAPSERLARWADRLPRGSGLRVGVAWSGNPEQRNDFKRSLTFDQLSPLWDIPGIEFVSLQKDVRITDVATLRRRSSVTDLSSELADFADTAAAMAQLDLVISVCTSTAHLAGALGRPLWVMLPFSADWRWLVGREDSPWYPSARLFRQSQPGDWAGVIERVANELRRHTAAG
jgi:tetratricopeptide (TPR) repeat protein